MSRPVYILGGHQTDFARNWTKQGLGLTAMIKEVTHGAFGSVKLEPHQVGSAHVGNFVGELFCGQGQLGGLVAEAQAGLRELPISRHEAACASGSMAALAAMTEIEAGRVDISCVLGLEMMRNVPGETAASHLGAAAWYGHEAQEARYVWPHMFSELMEEYQRRYGLDYRHLGAIAQKNLTNARANPNAQTRKWDLQPECFTEDDIHNPVVEGGVRRYDCGRVTDGAAVVFLASQNAAFEYAARHNIDPKTLPRIEGWGHRTARMSYAGKLEDSRDTDYVFPHVRRTIEDAMGRAKVQLNDLDLIETHDCFAITEYMAMDHFGITPAGKSWQAIENQGTTREGKLPVNPSGGLIGLGHPVGATGVRMLLDAWKQISGNAGDYQIEGATRAATLNIGGSTTTTAVFVVGREA